jgi:hypothetical protein
VTFAARCRRRSAIQQADYVGRALASISSLTPGTKPTAPQHRREIPAGMRGVACPCGLHCCDAGFQIVPQPLVVGVEECKQRSVTELDSAVACGPRTAILLTHCTHAGVSVSRDDLASAVGGAIVDDDHLEVGKGLGRRAFAGSAGSTRKTAAMRRTRTSGCESCSTTRCRSPWKDYRFSSAVAAQRIAVPAAAPQGVAAHARASSRGACARMARESGAAAGAPRAIVPDSSRHMTLLNALMARN